MYSNRKKIRENRAFEPNSPLAISTTRSIFRFSYLILILVSGVLTSQHVLALSCVNNANNSASLSESVATSIAVPQSVPDGTVVWRSEPRSMTVKCYMTDTNGTENVHAYYNPSNSTLPKAFSLGIILNGIDINSGNSSSGSGINTQQTIPGCTSGKNCKDVTTIFTINYSLYAKKSGTGTYTGTTFDLIQLDGKGGMNGTKGSNLIYTVNQLNNIRFIACNATASVSPNIVNFGSIVANKPVIGNVAKEKNFTITVSKTCNDAVKVATTYSSTQTIINGNEVDLSNGLSLQIKNLNSGSYIAYNKVESIADLSSMNSVTVPFLAQLKWNKNTAVKGSINSAVTFTFSYN